MNAEGLLVGATLVAIGLYTLVARQQTAAWIHEYYNSREDPNWRPSWLPWAFRPTLRQTSLMTWAFVLLLLSSGAAGILFGVGIAL